MSEHTSDENKKILENWADSLENYEIPTWEELPSLSLYMDQVITLMEEYLSVYKKPGDKLITPSMVNNYVKLGVIPKPHQKRYGRIHLAYLTMVCSLKQVLSISTIQKMLPLTLTEEEVEAAYCAFKGKQKAVFAEATKAVSQSLDKLNKNENAAFSEYSSSSVEVALTGNIYKILSEMIVDEAAATRE